MHASRRVFEVARIKFPYFEVKEMSPKLSRDQYIQTSHRAYARIDGKFVPIGWHITWSGGLSWLVTDEEIETGKYSPKL